MDDRCKAANRPTYLLHVAYCVSRWWFIAMFSASAYAQSAKTFDIPSGPIGRTLELFQKQAAITVDDQTDNPRIVTHALKGTYVPLSALTALLCGTGEGVSESPEPGTLVVKPMRSAIHIDAGGAASTLNEFSRQSGLQLLFDYNIVRGLKTRALSIDADACGALTNMLAGTKLVFDYVNAHTLAVTEMPQEVRQPLYARETSSEGALESGHVQSASASDASASLLDEVHISAEREQTHALVGADTARLSALDIDRSSAANVTQLIQTLPENFGGGPTEDTVLGREAASNSGLGIGMNLRGLGASATTSLLNGRPIAPSGTSASFADVSNIPLVALDHIDIVPAGSSLRYGSGDYGGIANFVLKRGFDGSETQARIGTATSSGLTEKELSQLWGRSGADRNVMVAFEYDHRSALDASARAQATSNLSAFGGSNFDSEMGNPGTIRLGSQTWAIPYGQDGKRLAASQLIAGTENLHDIRAGTTVLPDQERWSIYVTGERTLGDGINIFSDNLFSSRRVRQNLPAVMSTLSVPSTNPFYVNPADGLQPVQVLYGFLDDLGPQTLEGVVRTGNFAVGFDGWQPGGWTVSGGLSFSFEKQDNELGGRVDSTALNNALADSDPERAFDPFGDGSYTNPATLASIRSTATYELSSSYWLLNMAADRELTKLPAGSLTLSSGMDVRRQGLSSSAISAGTDTSIRQSRDTEGVFAEMRIPLIGEQQQERVVLGVGGRYERNSDVGSSFSPSIGAVWKIAPVLTVRGGWAELHKPSSLGDLSELYAGSELAMLPDSASPTGLAEALVRFGGNHGLKPERAYSRSLGLDIGTRSSTPATLALTYFDIDVRNQIDSLSSTEDFFGSNAFSGFVNRIPTTAERTNACTAGTLIGDLTSCLTAPIAGIVDLRLNNIARTETRGFDVATKSAWSTGIGDFDVGLNGTYILEFARAQTPTGPLIQLRNTQNNPLAAHVRGSLGWQAFGWGVFASANFSSSYRDIASRPEREVGSWTTFDLQLKYSFCGSLPQERGLTVVLEARNLFGRYPPFLNNPLEIGYDQENGDLSGRIVSISVRKRW
jgi:iron complex outermembrane recepter protein